MLRKTRKILRSERGQGMTEYIIIVALIAIAAIGVVTVFGQDIRELFGASTRALAGDTDVQNEAKAANQRQIRKSKGLREFGGNNEGNR
jgi:Flp pilus assembly pilin Flp